jgi:hypothetical protein
MKWYLVVALIWLSLVTSFHVFICQLCVFEVFVQIFAHLFSYVVLRIKTRISTMVGSHSTTELCPQPSLPIFKLSLKNHRDTDFILHAVVDDFVNLKREK